MSKKDFAQKEHKEWKQETGLGEETVTNEPVAADDEVQIGKKDISVKAVLLVLGGAVLCWFMLVNAAR